MPSRRTWCFTRFTFKNTTMSGNSNPRPSKNKRSKHADTSGCNRGLWQLLTLTLSMNMQVFFFHKLNCRTEHAWHPLLLSTDSFFKSHICTLNTGPGLAAKLFVMSQIIRRPASYNQKNSPQCLLMHQFVCCVKEILKMKFKPAFFVSLWHDCKNKSQFNPD